MKLIVFNSLYNYPSRHFASMKASVSRGNGKGGSASDAEKAATEAAAAKFLVL